MADEDVVRWVVNSPSLAEFFVNGEFAGMLGKYDEYWLVTATHAKAASLDPSLTEDEARATALTIWRMGLWRK